MLESLARKLANTSLGKSMIKQKSRDELHSFWRNPDKHNRPEGYVEGMERSKQLLELIKKAGLDSKSRILEIGPNVGRNLNYLFENGFSNLAGIEINSEAVRLMKEKYPEMSAKAQIYNQPAEEKIKEFANEEFDLVFSMAVLEHIHEDSAWIFGEMARIAGKVIITIEDESGASWRHFPRNYKAIFEGLGFEQIYERNCGDIAELDDKFTARIFIKKQ